MAGKTFPGHPHEAGAPIPLHGDATEPQEAPQASQDRQSEEIPPTLGADEVPPIAMTRYSIHFSSPGKSVAIPLEGLIETQNASGLLLYGLILKIHDLDVTLRRILKAGSDVRQGQPSPADLVKETLEGFGAHGLFGGIPRAPAAKGDGS